MAKQEEFPVQRALDRLWGAVVEAYAIDFERHRFVMELKVTEHEQTRHYKLRLHDVRAFEYRRDQHDRHGEPWDYVELTSAATTRIERGGQSVWRFEAELWNDELEVDCRRIELDGQEFAP